MMRKLSAWLFGRVLPRRGNDGLTDAERAAYAAEFERTMAIPDRDVARLRALAAQTKAQPRPRRRPQ